MEINYYTYNIDPKDVQCITDLIGSSEYCSTSWGYIPLHNGRYCVSFNGRWVIRLPYYSSNPRMRRYYPGTICNQNLNSDGYLEFYLTTVHRAVALTFVPGYDLTLVVNHKDGVKTHNDATNLEWVTQKENTQHYRTAACFEESRKIHDHKLSICATGKTHVCPEWLKARHRINNKRENLSPETLKRISEGLKGRRLEESSRRKIGEANRKVHTGRIVLNDGRNDIKVYAHQVPYYESRGWVRGSIRARGRVWVHLGSQTKWVTEEDFVSNLEPIGWRRGRK